MSKVRSKSKIEDESDLSTGFDNVNEEEYKETPIKEYPLKLHKGISYV